jgi:hypothetical protein
MRDITTNELASRIGCSSSLLRMWKSRGHLKLAPPGVRGQGRSVQCYWSEEAAEEAISYSETSRKVGCKRIQKI